MVEFLGMCFVGEGVDGEVFDVYVLGFVGDFDVLEGCVQVVFVGVCVEGIYDVVDDLIFVYDYFWL